MKKAENICDCDMLHKEAIEIVKPEMLKEVVFSDISTFFKVFGDYSVNKDNAMVDILTSY